MLSRRLRTALLGVALAMPIALPAQAAEHWTDAWATSLHSSAAAAVPPAYENQSIRMVVRMRGDGNQVRIRLSNLHGDRPVTFGSATVALRSSGPALVEGTSRRLAFGGEPSVTVPAGQDVHSDPVELKVRSGQDLAVSIYLPDATGPATWHRSAVQTNYLTAGDHTAEEDGGSFSTTVRSWIFLNAVAVTHGPTRDTLAALGDSVTDGSGTAVDGFERWPDYLAARLAGTPGRDPAVVNVGIGGNRVLADTAQDGLSALNRLEHDVLVRDGLRYVLLLEGTNDLRNRATAGQLVAAYRQIIDRVQAKGVKIIGGTLPPLKGSAGYSEALEAERQAVNTWITTGGAFDGVVDFATALADPADPLRYLPAYDRGDHIHPNATGFAAMADAVDLTLLR
ncbi:SGNH/GDSL hydrolase family protein [Nonomuraea sp. MG754425]|uniref:SGNH/GDSL hydrolase family protein n=1 Tax=Nonomuraea sp. MG754425 TaxID=2570319 RepID=UPI001F231CE4|nr:SGNH/GDSL hydrolase family protein [Nonomuraea sp. MG754425]MCF6473280.1 SGNH/GDSL hydrolase family protein [Nonomuraea sp. MG754425]